MKNEVRPFLSQNPCVPGVMESEHSVKSPHSMEPPPNGKGISDIEPVK